MFFNSISTSLDFAPPADLKDHSTCPDLDSERRPGVLDAFGCRHGVAGGPADGWRHSCCTEARRDERLYWARELHDRLGQFVAAATLCLHGPQRPELVTSYPAPVGMLTRHLHLMETEFRALLAELLAPAADEVALEPSLRTLAEQATMMTGVAVTLRCDPAALDYGEDLKRAILRIVQESLTNIAKHARGVTRIVVEIRVTRHFLRLLIENDGEAAGPAMAGPLANPQRATGVGMHSMRQRLQRFGGELATRTLSRGGFRVTGQIPLASILR